MIPAARASPSTLIMVRNLSLWKQPFPLNAQSAIKVQSRGGGGVVTYRIQSMATISVMSSGGRPTDVNTITMVTRPACGIPAAPMLAAVAVMLFRQKANWV